MQLAPTKSLLLTSLVVILLGFVGFLYYRIQKLDQSGLQTNNFAPYTGITEQPSHLTCKIPTDCQAVLEPLDNNNRLVAHCVNSTYLTDCPTCQADDPNSSNSKNCACINQECAFK